MQLCSNVRTTAMHPVAEACLAFSSFSASRCTPAVHSRCAQVTSCANFAGGRVVGWDDVSGLG